MSGTVSIDTSGGVDYQHHARYWNLQRVRVDPHGVDALINIIVCRYGDGLTVDRFHRMLSEDGV